KFFSVHSFRKNPTVLAVGGSMGGLPPPPPPPLGPPPLFVKSLLHSTRNKSMDPNRSIFLIRNSVFINHLFQPKNYLLAFIYYLRVGWLIKIEFFRFVFGHPDNIEYPFL